MVCLKNETVCNSEKEQVIYDSVTTFHKSKPRGRSHSQKYERIISFISSIAVRIVLTLGGAVASE